MRRSDVEELRRLLFGEQNTFSYPLKPLNKKAKSKNISGTARGGNLVVIQSHSGTELQLRGQECILFFEDIGERGYRVDRALWQLKLSGAFDRVKAVVFGDFSGGLEKDGRDLVRIALKEFAQSVSFPCFHRFEMGHVGRLRPLVLQHPVQLRQQSGQWKLHMEM